MNTPSGGWSERLPAGWSTFIAQVLSPSVLIGLSVCSGVLFFVSLLCASWAVKRLPADYLLREEGKPARGWARAWLVLRNAIGLVLFVMGIIMLALPGQGLLTILAAISVMNFPGKRRLEQRLMMIPSVLATINRLRRRSGHPPLLVPSRAAPEAR